MFYYIIRFIWRLFLILDFVILTAFLYLLTYLPKSLLKTFYHKLFRIWCWAFSRALGIDLKIHQKYKGRLPDQYLLIANHPSAFEDIGVPALFNVYSLAKIEVKKWFVVGKISEAAGTLYVHRESKESRNAAAEEIAAQLKSGKNIALYPEGGCKGRRIFQTFFYGAFDISLRTGIPILPVFLHYEAQEDFEWQAPYTLMDKIRHFLTTKNNRVNYYVFDPLNPEDFENKQQFMEYTHALYLKWQAKYLE
ncbi:MAG: lysophospholipid acyltransferase family protein [Gammaproteobacteria bacterium]|nr:lysophospholipid acyltransferase family protein [Gammaproteobacteria bacterium]